MDEKRNIKTSDKKKSFEENWKWNIVIKDVHFLLKQIECNREKKFHRNANWKNKKILKTLVLQNTSISAIEKISYINFRCLYFHGLNKFKRYTLDQIKMITFECYRYINKVLVSYHHALHYLFSYFIKQYPTTCIYIFSFCRVVHCSCCIHQRALSIKYFYIFCFSRRFSSLCLY